jgi:hypothetical protein
MGNEKTAILKVERRELATAGNTTTRGPPGRISMQHSITAGLAAAAIAMWVSAEAASNSIQSISIDSEKNGAVVVKVQMQSPLTALPQVLIFTLD